MNEALPRYVVVIPLLREELDRDDAIEPAVAGLVDDAHAAAAEFAERLVAAGARVSERENLRASRT
jgi:hypothetical protein